MIYATDANVRKAGFIKSIVEILAILLAAAWAIYTFYYQNTVLPKRDPPVLTIASTHTVVGETDSVIFIKSAYSIRNTSKARAHLLGSAYSLSVLHVQPKAVADSAFAAYVNRYQGESSDFLKQAETTVDLIGTGRLVSGSYRLDPEEEFKRSFLTAVRKTEANTLRFYAEVFASKDDGGKLVVVDSVGADGEIIAGICHKQTGKPLDAVVDKDMIKKLEIGRIYHAEECIIPQLDKLKKAPGRLRQ